MKKLYKALARLSRRLFDKGVRPFADSAENIEALDKLCEERKENIDFAIEKLGMKR